MTDALIDHLRQYAKLENSIEVERFEATLNQIGELKDPKFIRPLISFLDDNCEFPEVMFSIIHTIESFDHEIFCREIVKALPEFRESSPYWATVAHVAILNTPTVLAIYARYLNAADASTKQVAREMFTSIRETKPKFAERCNELLAIF